jgi:hypothetical protein
LRRNPRALDNLKLPGENFAFKLYGHMSYQTFRNATQLIDYLSRYRSIFDAAGDLRSEHLDEIFQNLQFYKLNPVDARSLIPSREEREKARRRRGRALIDGRRELTYSERLNRKSPEVKQRLLKKGARIAKQRRQSMSEEEREVYKEKARERARKSRERRK